MSKFDQHKLFENLKKILMIYLVQGRRRAGNYIFEYFCGSVSPTFPKFVSPLCCGFFPGCSTDEESALENTERQNQIKPRLKTV